MLWALALAGAYYLLKRRGRAAWVVGGLVLSHWVLDVISHWPEMPIVPGQPWVVGLGLWRSVLASFVTEMLMFAAGLWLYLSVTRARDRVGRYGLVALVIVLVVPYVAGLLGPPPPSVTAVTISNLTGSLVMLVMAAWIDRHREVMKSDDRQRSA